MLTVVPGDAGAEDPRDDDGGSSLIDTIVRDGAQRMLAEALQAEVEAYIDSFTGERDDDDARRSSPGMLVGVPHLVVGSA